FVKALRLMLAPAFRNHSVEVPVIKTVAAAKAGIAELYEAIKMHGELGLTNKKRSWLLTEKAYHLIQQKRMKDVQKNSLQKSLQTKADDPSFNLYQFVATFIQNG
ncbi:MAG: methylmalonyl Co-A mutase-associated GTPase MeaB, partial [Bacteroidota bacterium]|nr:methylmalonyl Co-A mutase-associated GTPase MeaB [Bacteroidota bacterium]